MPRRVLAAMAACLALAACATPPKVATPTDEAVGRVQALSFVEVVRRVEPVAEAECARLNPGANCDFRIVVDDRRGMPPNGYQMLDASGRPVLVLTASLIAEARNADELAFVMAHEASHHIAGHLDRMDRNALVGASIFGRIAREANGATPDTIRQAERLGAQVGARSFSKEFELEADRLGTRVAAQAGYDPLVGSAFFLRIPDPGDRFMGTHPSNAERIAVVRATVEEMSL